MLWATLAWLLIAGPSCTNSDNFALLGGTLKTMQQAACDDEIVSLACPQGTTISIQVAQYGKASQNHSCAGQMSLRDVEEGKRCLWPNAMQYSLLQKVVEACQKKPQCKFSTKPKPGLVDPCPDVKKFVEVAYRCRPNEFRSRTACENAVVKLSCNPYSRVAVLDAKYGRIAYEANTCAQTQGVRDESKKLQEKPSACSAPYAAETVMQLCHGKRRCSVIANSKTFGSPCAQHSRPYLKVVYACVPLGVLLEKYESAPENDEVLTGLVQGSSKGLYDESEGGSDQSYSNPVSPVADPALQPMPDDYEPGDNLETSLTIHSNANKKLSAEGGRDQSYRNPLSPIADPALQPLPDDEGASGDNLETSSSTHSNVEKKLSAEAPQSKWPLIVSVGGGITGVLLLIGILLAVHCYINHRSSGSSKTGDMFTTEPPNPNVFIDASSDIDNENDVSHISGTFYDPVHPDMILFRDVPGTKGTMRAMRPLSTIYPCGGVSMYGSDFVPSAPARELGPRTFSTEEPPRPRPEVMSPRSLSEYSGSHFRYG